MALFTGKGDDGTTKFFCPPGQSGRTGDQKRVSKNSDIAEALGSLDELNSYLGVAKIDSEFEGVLEEIQQNIFIINAHIAGAEKNISEEKVKKMEGLIAECEKELPEIKTFRIAGGTKQSAELDFARTLARRAERRVVAINDSEPERKISSEVIKYLNRLSSLLFALARTVNARAQVEEGSPTYK